MGHLKKVYSPPNPPPLDRASVYTSVSHPPAAAARGGVLRKENSKHNSRRRSATTTTTLGSKNTFYFQMKERKNTFFGFDIFTQVSKRLWDNTSVTRLGDLLDFGPLFKAFGNN